MSNLGVDTILHIAEIVVILFGGGGGLYKLGAFVKAIELSITQQNKIFDKHAQDDLGIAQKHAADLLDVRGKLERIAEAMTTLAVQREQIASVRLEIAGLRSDVNEMRHGRGFVTEDWPKKGAN